MSCSQLPLSEQNHLCDWVKEASVKSGAEGEFPLCHTPVPKSSDSTNTQWDSASSTCVATRKSKSDTYLWEQTMGKNLHPDSAHPSAGWHVGELQPCFAWNL